MGQSIHAAIAFILGNRPDGYYLASFFFAIIAVIISMYIHSRKRNVNSHDTPVRFSWYFLLWDNAKRGFIGVLVTFLLLRFFGPASMEWAVAISFFVAGSLDTAIAFVFENFNFLDFLKRDRDKLPTKP
jgi:hypothetical protein